MKKQILMLIIGILIGAIVTTGVFLLLKGNTQKQRGKMDRGDRMEMREPSSMDGNEIDGRSRGLKSNKRDNGSSSNADTEDSNI